MLDGYPPIDPRYRTGLCLFGAAFAGQNDGIYMDAAGLRLTIVDIDRARLDYMAALRVEWDAEYIEADAFTFHPQGRTWDVVSVDPFTNDMLAVPPDHWKYLAPPGGMVVVGTFEPVEGWNWQPRNSNVGWAWTTV